MIYYKRYTDFPEFEKITTDNFIIIEINVLDEFGGGMMMYNSHTYNCSRFVIQSIQHPENTFYVVFDDFNKGFIVKDNKEYTFTNYEEFKNIVY